MFVMPGLDRKNRPALDVLLNNGIKVYSILLTNAAGVFRANELLKSLDSGLKIEFESYLQYGQLILNINDAIRQKKATA